MSISFVAFQLGMDDKGWLDDPAMSEDDKSKRIANAVLSRNGPEKNRILFITQANQEREELQYFQTGAYRMYLWSS